ncbi:hypothetical protein SAMN04487983_101086 [Streptomyces sp. yr375]|nr:hypothetical protein SAMN04487983_101086 [Streptomyces sp. yr375]
MVDQGIIARGRCGDGKVTKYYDVTAPSIQRVHDTRFFPSRMSRVVSNGIQQYNSTDDLLRRLREQKETKDSQESQETKNSRETKETKGPKGSKGPKAAAKKPGENPIPLMPYEKRTRDQAVNYLSRFALTQMAQACGGGDGGGGGFQAVQVRMYARSLPPWSQRKNPDAGDKVDVYDFPWKKAADLQ